MRALWLVGVLLLGAVGCGQARTGVADPAPVGGDVPTTARALAAVMTDYTPKPSSGSSESDAAEEFKDGGVGAELRFPNADQQSDGDSLVLAVGTGLDKAFLDCDTVPDKPIGCAETHGGVLLWEKEAPEEDPGVVYVILPKEKGAVLMFYSGPKITKDPRELDLPITVDDLFDVAKDPRVDVTTSQGRRRRRRKTCRSGRSDFPETPAGRPDFPDNLDMSEQAGELTVVRWRRFGKSLASWLLRHGDVHSEETVHAVHEMARRSTTWH